MLTPSQYEEFKENGLVIIPNFLAEDVLSSLTQAADSLQGSRPYDSKGRWNLRNCLPQGTCFMELLANETLLRMAVQFLGFNIKLLGSQIVKMRKEFQAEALPLDWHRDGGALLAELPDPLPPAFIKVGFCISGSKQTNGGELLAILGSHRLIGAPVVDPQTGSPFGSSRILMAPGDMVVFDWRTWHAVINNSSDVIRRTLYFTFGFRWLSAMDYEVMPEVLRNASPILGQLLGHATELGHYLPTEEDVPLKIYDLDQNN